MTFNIQRIMEITLLFLNDIMYIIYWLIILDIEFKNTFLTQYKINALYYLTSLFPYEVEKIMNDVNKLSEFH